MKELPEELSDEINEKFEKSFYLKDSGDYESSYFKMKEAIALLPLPKEQWSESLIIITSACEHFISIDKIEDANELIDQYLNSQYCVSYDDSSSFIKGMVLYQMNDYENSYEWFKKANSISKGRCFIGKNNKYKEFFMSKK